MGHQMQANLTKIEKGIGGHDKTTVHGVGENY